MTPTPAHLLAIAQLAARRAGDMVAAASHDRRGDTASLNRHDVKHKLDLEAQAVATETIRSACENAVILGEETWNQPLPASDVLWIVDPIDGTINFFHGLPLWCCSIAASLNGRVVAGAVYAPDLGMLFEATSDGPSRCNGDVLRVSATDRLDLALVHTGMDIRDTDADTFRYLRCITGLAQRPRIMGSAALDICLVAAGKTDAYFESGVYIWDMAAAGLIAERAGGTCEILRTYKHYRRAFLASNGRLHATLRDAVTPLLHE